MGFFLKTLNTEYTEGAELSPDEQQLNDLSGKVIGAAIAVHRALGPGLLESTYEACLAHELDQLGIRYERQMALPVVYKKVRLDCGYRLDFLIENTIVLELKAVDQVHPIHSQQLLSYLRISNHRLGLLINFNVEILHHGVNRIINGKL